MIWRLTLSISMVFAMSLVGCTSPGTGDGESKTVDSAVDPDVVAQPQSSRKGDLDEPIAGEAKKQLSQTENRPAGPDKEIEEFVAFAQRNPFGQRIDMLPFPRQLEWLNTKPLRLEELRGKFVLIDFWTYCCINCLHILPELKKLEQAYPNELVVIGCHSAKFAAEKDSKNIAEAILRYEIEHPVINDANLLFWRQLGVQSWPTLLLIDPEGKAVWMRPGEIKFEDIDMLLKKALPFYRRNNLIDAAPIRFELLQHTAEEMPLRFPGKVLADEAGDRLFISDSNHNRIVVSSLDGKLKKTIGSGEIGKANGSYEECSFDHPQGMALHGDFLYVADTENHMLRKVDLKTEKVTTIAGRGEQASNDWLASSGTPGMPWRGVPLRTDLNSPWALLVHEDFLYIAMAGPHQIWRMSLKGAAIGPFAGNGREDIVDGPLLPAQPYGLGASSFAQPSGLTTDGTWLFVADSEGSSIRAVPFDFKKPVRTVVGTSGLPGGRLFEFGDRDGRRDKVLLQHPLGVVFHEGFIYVADTYNDKIKRVNAATGATNTLNVKGNEDKPFDEPEGVSYAAGTLFVADTNNHRIRTVNLGTGAVKTLTIQGLQPPKDRGPTKPEFRGRASVVPAATVKVVDGKVALQLKLELPPGWKINDLAKPQRYWITELGNADLIPAEGEGVVEIQAPTAEINVSLPVKGESGKTKLEVLMPFYYCEQSGTGLCKQGTVKWELPLLWSSDGKDVAVLSHSIRLFKFPPN